MIGCRQPGLPRKKRRRDTFNPVEFSGDENFDYEAFQFNKVEAHKNQQPSCSGSQSTSFSLKSNPSTPSMFTSPVTNYVQTLTSLESLAGTGSQLSINPGTRYEKESFFPDIEDEDSGISFSFPPSPVVTSSLESKQENDTQMTNLLIDQVKATINDLIEKGESLHYLQAVLQDSIDAVHDKRHNVGAGTDANLTKILPAVRRKFSKKPVGNKLQTEVMEKRKQEVFNILDEKINECRENCKERFLAVDGERGDIIFLHPVFLCHVLLKDQDLGSYNCAGCVSAIPLENSGDLRLEFQYFYGAFNVFCRTRKQFEKTLSVNCKHACQSILDIETHGLRLDVGRGRELVYGLGNTCLRSLKMIQNVLFLSLNQVKPSQPFITPQVLEHLIQSTRTFMNRVPIPTEVEEAKDNWIDREQDVVNIITLLSDGADGLPATQMTVEELLTNTDPVFLRRLLNLFHRDSDANTKEKAENNFTTLTADLKSSEQSSSSQTRAHTINRSYSDRVLNPDVVRKHEALMTNVGLAPKRTNKRGGTFQCRFCDKIYATGRNRDRHEQSHSGIIYKCPQCDKSYSSETSLRVHIVKHGRPKFVCNVMNCGKSFFAMGHYRRHLLAHCKS